MSRDIIFSTIDNGSRSLRWTGNCSGVILNGLTWCWSRIIRCLLFEECEGRVARLEDGDGRFSVDFAIDLTSCGAWMRGEGAMGVGYDDWRDKAEFLGDLQDEI